VIELHLTLSEEAARQLQAITEAMDRRDRIASLPDMGRTPRSIAGVALERGIDAMHERWCGPLAQQMERLLEEVTS
jgi:hypothetical protein